MKTSHIPQLRKLQNRIDRADQCYHTLGQQPLMTDEEYDGLKKQLKRLAPNDERHTRVGAPLVKAKGPWKEVKHARLIGSLANTMTEEEFYTWAHRKGELVGSPKIDGLTLVTNWKNGRLVSAVTRGNGQIGRDVTRNALMVKGIPQQLEAAFDGEIRGEVFLTWDIFAQLNAEMAVDAEPYSNPRNAASGIMARLDGQQVHMLEFWAHGIEGDGRVATEEAKFKLIETLGLTPVPYKLCHSPEIAVALHKHYQSQRVTAVPEGGRDDSQFSVPIDGVVFTVNSLLRQKDLGVSSKRPNYMTAFKFPALIATTILLDVEWQVS